MRVAITGASGFIGRAVSNALDSRGDDPFAIRRGDGPGTWDPAAGWFDPAILAGADAVIHLAGESVGGRWTDAKKARIMDSRRDGTHLLASAIAEHAPSVPLLSGSAIGYYGSQGDTELSESAEPGDGFLADVVRAWEAATAPAAAAGSRVALLRTALVLGTDGGSFPRMLLPFKLGIGGRIGTGRQYWAWITLEDCVRAILHVLDNNDISGPVNLAAPYPVRNADFTTALGSALHRPTVLPTPTLGLNLLLGAEFAREVLMASQRVVPGVLTDAGFEFLHPDLATAFDAIL